MTKKEINEQVLDAVAHAEEHDERVIDDLEVKLADDGFPDDVILAIIDYMRREILPANHKNLADGVRKYFEDGCRDQVH
jgi:hypothetical protein